MILGKITGKITTTHFDFLIEKQTKKFEYVQVLHKVYDYVLCQVVEIERTEKDIAKCIVIGYKDDKGRIKPIRIPFDHGTEVLRADDEFIKKVIKLEDDTKGAYIGKLEGKDIDILLDLKKLLTKHVAVLAKSGAGKSYTVGVLIEEIIEKKVPLLVIDPHGEYHSLRHKNEEDKQILAEFGLEPKAYKNVQEYGDPNLNKDVRPLKLNNNLTPHEIVSLIPGKLSNTQMGILYNAIKHLSNVNFTNVILELEKEESNTKWTLINNLEYLNNLNIFTDSYLPYNEIIQPGRCSIINLKGISPDVQQIIVYKLMKDLFGLRKKEKIPPFFVVIEEAHNYCPERSFGEAVCSKILRTVASEGRKFGLGLCVVSQRPARVDKSVLSQCTTQIIMKVTNPNDLKAVSKSVEGITAESEDEIRNLPIGTALVAGIVDMPLFVNIRPRMSKHGGQAANVLDAAEDYEFFEKVDEFAGEDLLPVIMPKTTIKDIKIMSEKEIDDISILLVPALLFLCKDKTSEYNVLIEMTKGEVVSNVDLFETKIIPNLESLSPKEIKILQIGFKLKKFTASDLVKNGMPIEVKDSLDILLKKGLIQKNDKYSLSDKYVFSHLSKYACFEKIQFLKVNYSDKSEAKVSVDDIKEKLAKFADIKDQRECNIVKYDISYKE